MLALLTTLLPVLSGVLTRIIPDAGQAAAAQIELQKALIENQGAIDTAIAEAAKAQNEVNLAEAQNPSLFVSGWRPAAGWVCVAGLTYAFLLQPTLAWGVSVTGAAIGADIPAPPAADLDVLLSILGGMLGLGALRTAEKKAGAARIS